MPLAAPAAPGSSPLPRCPAEANQRIWLAGARCKAETDKDMFQARDRLVRKFVFRCPAVTAGEGFWLLRA